MNSSTKPPRFAGTTGPLTQPRSERRHTPKVDTSGIYKRAVVDSFKKLDPRVQIKNPVMFVVEIGTVLTLLLTFNPQIFGPSHVGHAYNGVITVILFVTLLFANFAEAVAEGRGKAQADSLRKTKGETMAHRRTSSGSYEDIGSSMLRKGDVVRVPVSEMIPGDGEVI